MSKNIYYLTRVVKPFIMDPTITSKVLLVLVVNLWIVCSASELIEHVFDAEHKDTELVENNAKKVTISSDLLVHKQKIIFTNGYTLQIHDIETDQTSTVDLSEAISSNLQSQCSYSVKIHAVGTSEPYCWLTFCIQHCENPSHVINCLLFVPEYHYTYVDSELLATKRQPFVHKINEESNRVIILSMTGDMSQQVPNGDVRQLEAEVIDTFEKFSVVAKASTDTILKTQFSFLTPEQRENVYIIASKMIKTADGRSLLVSIVVNSTLTIPGSNKVFFSSVVSDVSSQSEKEQKESIRVINGKCNLARYGAPCVTYSTVTGRIGEVSITDTRVLLGINKMNANDPFSFCSFSTEQLFNKYDQCLVNETKCAMGAFDSISPKTSKRQLLTFGAYNSDGMDMVLAAVQDYPDGKISLQRFRAPTRPYDYLSDPLDTNIHWDSLEKTSISNIRIEQEFNYGAFIFNNSAVFKVNELKPTCSEAAHCFHCQSNLFNLGSRCEWNENSCTEATSPPKAATCTPYIEKILGPLLIYKQEGITNSDYLTPMTIYGIGFSITEKPPKLTCEKNPRTNGGNMESTSKYPTNVEAKFAIQYFYEDVKDVEFLNCSISFSQQNFTSPEGFAIEQIEIPLPYTIPFVEYRIDKIYPLNVPLSSGFSLTIEGENLWDGLDCFHPELTLKNDGNENMEPVNRTLFKSRNKVTFLLDAPSSIGLTEGEWVPCITFFSSYHNYHCFNLWQRIIIKDEPRNVSIAQ